MRSFLAFFKKEWLQRLRTGRLWIFAGVFVLLGIMNPAVAYLTPWLMETLSESLEASGMVVQSIQADALASWVQFYKNIPMGLIVFMVLESSSFTGEYRSGTLILTLTKGMPRYQVVLSKALVPLVIWSAGYWLCYGITWGSNALLWDNGIAFNLGSAAFLWWLLGCWTIGLCILASTLFSSYVGVLLSIGGGFLGVYLLSLLPKVYPYCPTSLMDGASLIYGLSSPEDYTKAAVVAAVSFLICLIAAIPVFNKKSL